ncbi:MAG: MarR family winged helix-turn-helix transcriptional regulator [Bacteroidia bacterium]|nr:MarR family winged helix-turn-helix transcriptional regulator [Bacteroidia bacterium]
MANTEPNIEQTARNIMLLQDVFRKHQHEVEKKFDISYLEMELIQFVLKSGHLKMKDVADNFFIKLSTLTTIIDKAESHKLLKRVPSKEDRRVVFLEVTKKGEDIYNKYVELVKDITERLKSKLGEEDFNQLVGASEKFVQMPLI